jgi:putative transposase
VLLASVPRARLCSAIFGPRDAICWRPVTNGFRIALMSQPRRRKPRVPRQLTFAERPRKDGKPRRKPGPRAKAHGNVRHRTRPDHKRWNPLHVTLRGLAGLPSFRSERLYRAFDVAFRTTRRADFRIVEFSVQDTHVHMIVEADDNGALARGMKSFSVRANRLFNSAHGRGRGRVWGDRYHRRELTCPRSVRNALVYCLCNHKKHFRIAGGARRIDPCSSARWFKGWTMIRTADDGPRPTEGAVTYLLRRAWKDHGLIDPGERPAHADAGTPD